MDKKIRSIKESVTLSKYNASMEYIGKLFKLAEHEDDLDVVYEYLKEIEREAKEAKLLCADFLNLISD